MSDPVTIRIHMLNGDTIDRHVNPRHADTTVQTICESGIRDRRGNCVVVYPYTVITKVEIYDEGSEAPIKSTPTKRPARRKYDKHGTGSTPGDTKRRDDDA